jgi:hypothetical protein
MVWTDDDDHDPSEWFGTVGEIEFRQVRGTFISQTLELSEDARKIPSLILPFRGQMMDVRMFRGGRIVRG